MNNESSAKDFNNKQIYLTNHFKASVPFEVQIYLTLGHS